MSGLVGVDAAEAAEWRVVYENVIVPFDGTNEGRVGLAVAGDLAWRSGAKVVIVNNTDASGRSTKDALKSRAMSLSGADVDFWVDTDHTLPQALIAAAEYRSAPVICLSTKGRGSSLFSKRWTLPPLAEEVLREADAPVLVVGPNADTSRGLPMTEIVVATDGSTESEQILPLAAQWAQDFKLRLLLIGVVPAEKQDDSGELTYLASLIDAVRGDLRGAQFELLRAPDPVAGIVGYLKEHEDAVLAMCTHGRGGRREGLGSVATKLVERSPRAILFKRAE